MPFSSNKPAEGEGNELDKQMTDDPLLKKKETDNTEDNNNINVSLVIAVFNL